MSAVAEQRMTWGWGMAAIAGLCLGAPAFADVELATPEDVGLSAERLERIDAMVERYVDAGEISGAVTLVARHGRIAHWEAHGVRDLDSGEAMERDTMFRIASMSKPVAAVAVLMLKEEGLLRLQDPVSRFLPQFADLEVAVSGEPGDTLEELETVPAEREITVLDLLTHTSGLMSGPLGNALGQQHAADRHELGLEWVESLDEVPLDFQPGERWAYSALAGFDVLSRIVEVVSGQSFDEFLAQRLFEPLDMADTSFWPSDAQRERLVGSYVREDGELVPRSNPGSMSGERYFSGAGGLMTTAYDYARFAMMLADGGEIGDRRLFARLISGARDVLGGVGGIGGETDGTGERVLSPRIAQLMGSPYITDELTGRSPGEGYGLGVRVVTDPIAGRSVLSEGSFGWSGLYGTFFWVDPAESLVAVLLIQTPVVEMWGDFETAVMQALID